jgi:cation diffusion facilitator family transporter
VQDGSRKAIIAAFFANLGIAVAKFAGFLLTGSAGLLAEAGHSIADTGNQGLLMLGGRRGKRPADDAHPFGYGPERYFWSFVVALVLFSMGGLFALYEGIQKLINPHAIEHAGIAYAILLLSIALESFSLRTAVKEANHVRGRRTWWQFIRTAKAPELPVVLLEDFGAEIGLAFALVGLTLAEVTGNARWDAVGSIAIGALLICIAMVLAVEMKGLLIGEAASDDDLDALTSSINGTDEVNSLIHLRTMHLSPDQLLVAAKVDYHHDLSVAELAAAIDRTERNIRAAVPIATTIYLEPDIRRSSQE